MAQKVSQLNQQDAQRQSFQGKKPSNDTKVLRGSQALDYVESKRPDIDYEADLRKSREM